MICRLALASLLIAGVANAQALAAGVGFAAFDEKVQISPCGPASSEGLLRFTVFEDQSWIAELPFDPASVNSSPSTAGRRFFYTPIVLSGSVSPVDDTGKVWALAFDQASLLACASHLELVANALCPVPVEITSGQIDAFLLKLKSDGLSFSLWLKTSASGFSALRSGRGRHQLKAKGSFATGFLETRDHRPALEALRR